MNPGVLDRKIVLQAQAPGLPLTDAIGNILTDFEGNVLTTNSRIDRFGQALDVWGTWKVRKAKKVESKASESVASGRKKYPQPVMFQIRYTEGVSQLNRILYKSRAYDIISVIELGRRQYQQIDCVDRGSATYGECAQSDGSDLVIDLADPCIRYDLGSYAEQSDASYIYYSWESPTSGIYYAERLNISTGLLDGRRQAPLPRPQDLTSLSYN